MPSDAGKPCLSGNKSGAKVLSDGNRPASPAAAVPLDTRMEDLVPIARGEGAGRPGEIGR